MTTAATQFHSIETITQAFAVVSHNRHLYGVDHDRSRSALRQFALVLHDHLEGSEQDKVMLSVRQGRLEFDGIPIEGGSNLHQLGARLENVGIAGLGLGTAATIESIGAFLDWLRNDARDPDSVFSGMERLLVVKDDEEIVDDESMSLDPKDWGEFKMPLRVYEGAADVLDRAHKDVMAGRDLDLEEIDEIASWTAEEVFRNGARMLSPLQLLQQDSYTYQHSVNVYLIASTLLRPLARDHHELAKYARAALLHDIGKSLIPDSILHKNGRLTDAELSIMQRHPELGAKLLANYSVLEPIDIEVAYCHHMRDDGLGYPVTSLPLTPGPITNVVQVADMFEALTAHRPYKDALSVDQAVDAIQRTPGMKSKQAAVWLLMSQLTMSPPGSEVILTTGERGVVLSTRPEEPTRPMVMITSDRKGAVLTEPHTVDLFEERNASGNADRFVAKVILRFDGNLAAGHAA